jgi:hypothetical protein
MLTGAAACQNWHANFASPIFAWLAPFLSTKMGSAYGDNPPDAPVFGRSEIDIGSIG